MAEYKGVPLPEPGGDRDEWGDKLNEKTFPAIVDRYDEALADVEVDGTTLAFVRADGAPGPAADMSQAVTGAVDAAVGTAVAPIESLMQQVAEQAPTVEQLEHTTALPPVDSATTIALAVAAFPQRVERAALAFAEPVPASDTDYWTVELLRYRDGAVDVIASKSTKTTGGEPITAFTSWSFDQVPLGLAAGLLFDDVLAVRATSTGEPPALSGGVVTWRSPAADVEASTDLVFDDFNRPNGPLGTAPTGQAWEATKWAIIDQRAATVGTEVAMVETGTPDVTITCRKIAEPSSSTAGIAFRCIDQDNHLGLAQARPIRVVGGTATNLALYADGMIYGPGDTARVVCQGSSIQVWIDKGSVGDFVLAGTYSETAHQTATKHGLRTGAGQGGRMDDFRVTTNG